MLCGRCGNENAEGNRFCGMCGAALVGKDRDGGQVPAAGVGGAVSEQRAAVSADVKADAAPSSAPVITGPSFLGLGAPAGGGSGHGGTHGDRHADGGHDALRPSSNVDYLLDDVEEPRRGRGKWLLVVVALALAVGFGYLHWKRGGFDWLNAGEKKPSAAVTPTPDAGPSGADSGGTATTAGSAAPQAEGAAAPAAGAAGPAESGAAPATPSQDSSAAGPSPGDAAPGTTQGAEQQSPQSSAGDSAAGASGAQAAESDSEKQAPPAEETPRAVARKPAARAAAKPAATKPAAAKAADSVTEAERYIYGRGVAQDCDRGLRMLKPAAAANVKAMISLGGLYSTGTCTPRDLPTAYRWFALALHKEPDNQALQEDLQKLWSQMTQPERQLAIKLSQ